MKKIVAQEEQTEFIENVAAQLMKSFLMPLKDFISERSYCTHVGMLSEILEWAMDFSANYYHKVCNWTNFRESKDNFLNADSMEEFVTGFGHLKFVKFCMEHSGYGEYFLDKYRSDYD